MVNNIVSLDEDTVITQDMMDKIENVDKPIQKKVLNKNHVDNGKRNGYVSQLFSDEYQTDVIRSEYNKFGEIAFVDDNDY